MKATLNERFLLVERTETDKPQVEEPYPRPKKVTAAEFNSWRKNYRISFDTEAEARAALTKVSQLGDFDKAAAWLDKQ
jgi:hypothetical protein